MLLQINDIFVVHNMVLLFAHAIASSGRGKSARHLLLPLIVRRSQNGDRPSRSSPATELTAATLLASGAVATFNATPAPQRVRWRKFRLLEQGSETNRRVKIVKGSTTRQYNVPRIWAEFLAA